MIGVVCIYDGLEFTHDSVLDDESLLNFSLRDSLKRHKKHLKNNKNYFDNDLREKGALLYLQRLRNSAVYTKNEEMNFLTKNQEKLLNKNQQKKPKNIKKIRLTRNRNCFYLMHCFKYYNGQKLDSHRWFLKGFCKMFPPEYIAFIDCGAKPERDAIFNLFLAMEGDPQVAGVCGYMSLYKQSVFNEDSQRVDHEW